MLSLMFDLASVCLKEHTDMYILIITCLIKYMQNTYKLSDYTYGDGVPTPLLPRNHFRCFRMIVIYIGGPVFLVT